MLNPQEEANKLIKEAKDILTRRLLNIIGIHETNISMPDIDRFVDCIVSASILQTTVMIKEVLFASNDTTDKPTKE